MNFQETMEQIIPKRFFQQDFYCHLQMCGIQNKHCKGAYQSGVKIKRVHTFLC